MSSESGSLLKFYVNLYVARRNTDENLNQKRSSAVKSWLSLKKEDKKLIKKKYDEFVNDRAKRQAELVKNMKPFMKRKKLSSQSINSINDNIEIDCPEGNIDHPYNETIYDKTDNSENMDPVEMSGPHLPLLNPVEMSEPQPPLFKNTREFYLMMQSANKELQESWSELSTLKKQRIRSAASKLKRDYIENYIRYLNSKPDRFLHELLKKGDEFSH